MVRSLPCLIDSPPFGETTVTVGLTETPGVGVAASTLTAQPTVLEEVPGDETNTIAVFVPVVENDVLQDGYIEPVQSPPIQA
jgi:hypothetical protein